MDTSKDLITLIWHGNVLRMKGRRMYSEIIDYLYSQDVVFCTGRQMYEMVESGRYS